MCARSVRISRMHCFEQVPGRSRRYGKPVPRRSRLHLRRAQGRRPELPGPRVQAEPEARDELVGSAVRAAQLTASPATRRDGSGAVRPPESALPHLRARTRLAPARVARRDPWPAPGQHTADEDGRPLVAAEGRSLTLAARGGPDHWPFGLKWSVQPWGASVRRSLCPAGHMARAGGSPWGALVLGGTRAPRTLLACWCRAGFGFVATS